mgnify:CR=1 FL=1
MPGEFRNRRAGGPVEGPVVRRQDGNQNVPAGILSRPFGGLTQPLPDTGGTGVEDSVAD